MYGYWWMKYGYEIAADWSFPFIDLLWWTRR